jgi:hypothetical protein
MMIKRNKILIKWLPVSIFIIGILLLLSIKLVREQNDVNNNINFRLKTAAETLDLIISDSLIEAANNKKNINSIYYENLRNYVDKIASVHKVDYVYAVIENHDSVYFALCNVLATDISKNIEIKYLDLFAEAPAELKSAFNTNTDIIYCENTNVWGNFRSAYIPKTTKSGFKYVLCSDVYVSEIYNKIWVTVIEFFISLLYVFIISFPIIKTYIRKY